MLDTETMSKKVNALAEKRRAAQSADMESERQVILKKIAGKPENEVKAAYEYLQIKMPIEQLDLDALNNLYDQIIGL